MTAVDPAASLATPTRRVTINDVAAAAGVAASTVSRALAKPARVHPATRERIERAARELGYASPAQLRGDVGGHRRTQTVAVLVSDVTNPFYFGIIRGTQQQLRASGYSHLLIDTEDSAEWENQLLHKLRPSIDGAVLAASRLSEAVLTEVAAEMPVVTINRNVANVPSVIVDSPAGVAHATEHLISLGHRRVASACGPATSWANEARSRAMYNTMAAHGLHGLAIGPFAAS
jgi:DNA-binding LacI/PurR family transcriptional regulator